MSHTSYDSNCQTNWQEEDRTQEEWKRVIEPLLPADWRQQAQQLKAWQRARKVKEPGDLLRALLLYAALSCSFRTLGIWASLAGMGSLCERAWRKRLVKSAAWIQWLLASLLRARVGMAVRSPRSGRVLLVDATHLAVLAGHGDDVRLHCAYDVCEGKLNQVTVTDRHVSEQVSHLQLEPGDIVVTDAGYPAGRSVEYTREQKAFLAQRISPHHVRLEERDGNPVVLKERIEQQAYGEWSQQKFWLRLPQSQQRVQVRVIAFRLPKAQALAAQERKAHRLRQQYGHKYSREAVWWAQWCLVLTTLPEAEWDAQSVLDLYRARWQIELVFKRFKQSQGTHRLPFRDPHRAQIVVQLHLIVWVLQEELAAQLQEGWEAFEEEEREEPASQPEEAEAEPCWPGSITEIPTSVAPACNQLLLLQVSLAQLQQILRGSCPTWRLIAAWPSLQRYWSTRRRRRTQGPAIQEWVSARLVAVLSP